MNFSIKIDPATWQRYISTPLKGKALLLDPFTNKGTAFTARERDELDLQGLVPPAICTMEQQLERVYESFLAKPTPLEKFIYLASLQDRNETLFFRLVHERIDDMLPIVYTPTVGEACQRYSHIYRRGRGLYVSYEQRDRIDEVLCQLPHQEPVGDRRHRRRAHSRPRRPGRRRHGHPHRQALPLHHLRRRLPVQHPADHARRRHRQRRAAAGSALPRPAPQAGARRRLPGVHRPLRRRRAARVSQCPAAVGGLPQGQRHRAAAPLPRPAADVQRRHPGNRRRRPRRDLRRPAADRAVVARPAASLCRGGSIGAGDRLALCLGSGGGRSAGWRGAAADLDGGYQGPGDPRSRRARGLQGHVRERDGGGRRLGLRGSIADHPGGGDCRCPADHPDRCVRQPRHLHGERREADGPRQRSPDDSAALQPDVEERVHG